MIVRNSAMNLVILVALSIGFVNSATASEEGSQDVGVDHLMGNKIGPTVGFEVDRGRPFLGVDGRFTFDVHPEFALSVNPALRYIPLSGSGNHFLQLDGNALAKYPVSPEMTVYGGLGLAVVHHRSDGALGFDGTEASSSNTRVAFNLLVGGVEFDIDESMDGFGQIQLTRYSTGWGLSWTMISIGGGLHFDI